MSRNAWVRSGWVLYAISCLALLGLAVRYYWLH